MLLAKMAVRRRANDIGDADFQVYAEDLERFDEGDVQTACERIGRTERGEGETAFPSIGTLIAAVQRARSERREEEDRLKRQNEDREYYARCKAEGVVHISKDPDFQAVMKKFNARFGASLDPTDVQDRDSRRVDPDDTNAV